MSKASFTLGFIAGVTSVGVAQDDGQWETLFEGTVETTQMADLGCGFNYDSYLIIDHIGINVRLTVDGVSRIYTVTNNGTMVYAGNLYLVDKNATDDDFGLVIVEFAKGLGILSALYTRTAGTHTVKIERMMN